MTTEAKGRKSKTKDSKGSTTSSKARANANENTNQTSPAPPLISDEERKKQLLRSMPTPKIPPFVKSDPPCEFHDDPSTWIEWLETEVLKFKQIQESKKEKGNLLKVS